MKINDEYAKMFAKSSKEEQGDFSDVVLSSTISFLPVQGASTYRPGTNGFSKHQSRIGIGLANTLTYIYLHCEWPRQIHRHN